jgi:beta-glucosidase
MDHELSLSASVLVKNTGAVPGAEIVQLYVTLPKEDDPAPAHVPLALRAFEKTDVLAPNSDVRVELALDKYAVSMWDERIRAWVVAPGTYHVQVGQSSVVLPLHATFQLERGFEWNGL